MDREADLKRALVALVIAWAMPAQAAPASFAKQVAEAKAGILEAADEGFNAMWANMREKSDAAGIGAAQARVFAIWQNVGFSFGSCQQQLTASDRANWTARFEDFASAMSGGSPTALEDLRAAGAKFWADGTSFAAGNPVTQSYCKVEVEAARQILASL